MKNHTMEKIEGAGARSSQSATREELRPEVVVRRLLDEGFTRGRLWVVDELVADDMQEHQPRGPGHPPGPGGVKAVIGSLRLAFSDFQLSVQDLAVAGDVVWTRNLATGTHDGPFGSRAPTGRRIAITVSDVMRVKSGQIVEHWGLPDHLTLMGQLGA
jgi:predicted ester cyclase